MSQKSVKRQNARLWLMFIDYAKPFDTVDHDALWTTLKEFGVPPHLIWLLKRLYDETKGVQWRSQEFDWGGGIRFN